MELGDVIDAFKDVGDIVDASFLNSELFGGFIDIEDEVLFALNEVHETFGQQGKGVFAMRLILFLSLQHLR